MFSGQPAREQPKCRLAVVHIFSGYALYSVLLKDVLPLVNTGGHQYYTLYTSGNGSIFLRQEYYRFRWCIFFDEELQRRSAIDYRKQCSQQGGRGSLEPIFFRD